MHVMTGRRDSCQRISVLTAGPAPRPGFRKYGGIFVLDCNQIWLNHERRLRHFTMPPLVPCTANFFTLPANSRDEVLLPAIL
jgi:hypothetical protein